MSTRAASIRLVALAVACLAPCLVGSASAADKDDGRKQVLVLYPYRRESPVNAVAERELRRTLGEGLAGRLDYYGESIDAARFRDSAYTGVFRDLLIQKYRNRHFDIIIAISDSCIEFVNANRAELFGGTPMVFVGTARTPRAANSTGVIAGIDFGRTLTLAVALQPELKNVFVVGGSTIADNLYVSIARPQFTPFEQALAFTYLTNLSVNDLERRVATLPPHSIVCYVFVAGDTNGATSYPTQVLDRLAGAANAPVYTWYDVGMGHGIVGGSLIDNAQLYRRAGERALRVLRGEAADAIPVSAPDPSVNQVDWRQLRRWGIDESRVPAGTLILFREPSAWDQYKVYILSAMVLIVAQAALIAGLLAQRVRRRRAEQGQRVSEAALRASQARIGDLGSRLLGAHEEERARIARELHDDISQQVALLSVDLLMLESGKGNADVRDVWSRTEGLARSVHDLSHRLHPAKLEVMGLIAALEELRKERERQGVTVRFTHHGVPARLPPEITLCLFRIAQEGLHNAIKHSGVRAASVELAGRSDGLALRIVDEGAGFDVETRLGQGLGLRSMRERLGPLRGTLEIVSVPGAGTCLEVTVPLDAPLA